MGCTPQHHHSRQLSAELDDLGKIECEIGTQQHHSSHLYIRQIVDAPGESNMCMNIVCAYIYIPVTLIAIACTFIWTYT